MFLDWKTEEERLRNYTPGHTVNLRQSPELISDNSAGIAGEAEMWESEPVFTYQFLDVFPKLSLKWGKYAKCSRAWDKLKHCCRPFYKKVQNVFAL